MTAIVVVDDGQFLWGAERGQLTAALARGGWVHAGSGIWREPAYNRDNPADEPYAVLCGRTGSVAGEGSGEPVTCAMLETADRFTYRPDLGGWLMDGLPAEVGA